MALSAITDMDHSRNFGAENELKRYLNILGRRRTLLFTVAIIIALAGTSISLLLPAIYRSSAVILIERQEIPSELVRSTITSFADQRIQMISQRAMTSENLSEIIEKYNLYVEERKATPREVVLEQMRDDVRLEMISAEVVDPRSGRPGDATIAFSLSYENKVPNLAQRVANELVTLYLNENVKTRTESAEDTSEFLTAEADRLGSRVKQLEQTLAKFKEQNVDRMPEISSLNRELLDRTDRDIAETERRIEALKERKTYLEVEMAQVKRFETLRSERGERVLSPTDRLHILEVDLSTLRARYGASHPDVVRLEREVQAMAEQVGGAGRRQGLNAEIELAQSKVVELSARYNPNHPDVRKAMARLEELRASASSSEIKQVEPSKPVEPDNPAYLQFRAQVNGTNAELQSMHGKLQGLHDKRADLERRLAETPSVEGEYRALLREYENTVAQHREIAAKQMQAQLSESMESGRKGERFTLIEPPLLPEEPHRPNRLAIFLAGILLAITGSLTAVGVAEAMDNSVRGRSGVMAVTGVPPLGIVPIIDLPGTRKKNNVRTIIIGLLLLFALFLVILAVHHSVMPVDVLWFVLLRKLGV